MTKLLDRLSVYVDKYLSSRIVFFIDLAISILSSSVTLLLLLAFTTQPLYTSAAFIIQWLGASVIFTCAALLLTRSYRIIIRHSTTKDFGKLLLTSAVKDVLIFVLFVFVRLAVRHSALGFGVPVALLVDIAITFVALVSCRVLMTYAYDAIFKRAKDDESQQKILVYGLSDKSVAIITRLQHSPHYKVIGFITPGHGLKAFSLSELPIFHYGNSEEALAICKEHRIKAVLFSTTEEAHLEHSDLINHLSTNGVKVLIAPTIDEIPASGIIQSKLREINIEDLLGRPEIKISMSAIKEALADRVILITGAAGSIGSELCRQIATTGVVRKIVLFDNAETPMHNLRLELEERFPKLNFVPVIGDVRSVDRLNYVFRRWAPSVVFHAAAYKHVPLMEENPCEAVLVNVIGSRNLADKCLEYGVEKMVMVSTDKAVNPTNVMGCTKRLAEIYVQSLGLALASGRIQGKTKFITTRFGNVLGSNGSVIPRFREQIAKGGPVTVTSPDINRFFMSIPEACRLVLEASTISKGNEICVFDMGEPVKIDTLARRMIELAGYIPDKDIPIKYTGLRPGEKLYEEVLASAENTLPTSHSRIRIAAVREYDYDEAMEVTRKLEDLSTRVDLKATIEYMLKVVPEFKSENQFLSDGK